MARQRHEFGDVHALIADPLDAAGDVHQRGDEPQVAGDRRLTRKQCHNGLLDLKTAPFDPVPVSDGHSRQLDVLVYDRFQRSVECLAHHLEPADSLALELDQVFAELVAGLLDSPNRTPSSGRLWDPKTPVWRARRIARQLNGPQNTSPRPAAVCARRAPRANTACGRTSTTEQPNKKGSIRHATYRQRLPAVRPSGRRLERRFLIRPRLRSFFRASLARSPQSPPTTSTTCRRREHLTTTRRKDRDAQDNGRQPDRGRVRRVDGGFEGEGARDPLGPAAGRDRGRRERQDARADRRDPRRRRARWPRRP